MFQFPGFASLARYHVFNMVGCPIRTSADHILFADPRSFSQLITSFFASESLGIPHTPLLTSITIFFTYVLALDNYITTISSFYFYYSFISMSMNSFVNLVPEEMKLMMAHLQFRFRD